MNWSSLHFDWQLHHEIAKFMVNDRNFQQTLETLCLTYFGRQQWLWLLNWVLSKNILNQNGNFRKRWLNLWKKVMRRAQKRMYPVWPFKPYDQNLNSHLLHLFISYRCSGEKLVKYHVNSSCMIMSVILLTTLLILIVLISDQEKFDADHS